MFLLERINIACGTIELSCLFIRAELETQRQVMLFTYTDKDGFVPPSDKAGAAEGGLTTGDGGPFSYLEEAVTSMPRTAATSLLETAKTAAGGGRGARGGGAGGRNSRAGVSDTAAVIQAHLAREDKYKVLLRARLLLLRTSCVNA